MEFARRNLFAALLAGSVVIAAAGAIVTHQSAPQPVVGPVGTRSHSQSGFDGEALARLEEFARAPDIGRHGSIAKSGDPLPDVETMIERLVARLAASPGDVAGWRTLAWSYSNTGRPEKAAAAAAKAAELEPAPEKGEPKQ